MSDQMPEWAREMKQDVKACLHHLTGNGTPERGIIVRLDRLEQSQKSTKWWGGFIIPAAVGTVCGMVGSVFRSKGL